MPTTKIDLDKLKSLATGSERVVYTQPNLKDPLLKVMRKKHMRAIEGLDDTRFGDWLKVRRAYGVYRREQRAWTDAMLRAATRAALPPLAGVGDFVLTDQGLGQLVEHIQAAPGQTAITLHDVAGESAISEFYLEKLNEFVAELYAWHIPAYDLGPKNIVWHAERACFVLVDGFGDRALVPLVTWFRAANNWKLDRAFEKTAKRSTLIWDRKTRRFA